MCAQILHIEVKKLIGNRIKELRKAKGWSQENLAELSDLSYKYLGEVERAVVNPSLDTLISIADGLEISVAELFTSGPYLVLPETELSKAKIALSELATILRSN